MFDSQPFGISPWVAFSLFHVVMAFVLWKMAERTKEEPKWFAVLPLLNMILLLKIAKKPMWWLILFFLPIVNIVALIMATMALCERFGVEKWWGLVAILSPFNLILYVYLAYGTEDKPTTPSTQTPPAAPAV
jgi:hypothetical protein